MTTTHLTSEFSSIWLMIDTETGAPSRVGRGDDPTQGTPLTIRTSIIDGGTERRGPDGGLTYSDTSTISLAPGTAGRPRHTVEHDRRIIEIDVDTTAPDHWAATWRYEFSSSVDGVGIALVLHARSDDATLRNLHLDTDLGSGVDGWRIHSPGNAIRPGLARSEFVKRTIILPMTGVDGSTGLVAAERTGDRPETIVLWPESRTAIGDTYLLPTEDGGITFTWQTDLGGRPGSGGSLSSGTLHVDHVGVPFADVLASMPQRLAALGIVSPNDPPDWARAASIYEVQIGYGVFPDGWTYSPYPTPDDLLADLDRIHALGYDTLQIMPRQPYPSYNVHDYADITTSYGDESVIRAIVSAAHDRGMRVILDILLHGVVDKEVVREAIATIETGPVAHLLDGPLPDITTLETGEADAILVTWSRHLLDFGPHWIDGSPERHRLVDEHPDWFCRDSAGHITSRYSRAFDVAHPGWQRYFIDSCLDIVRRLDIDGFRLDAPSYNSFHNWSDRTRTNAAVSMLGALPLFDQLRVELRALKPDALLYTEPAGALWRVAMDINYDYDELFLIRALLGGEGGSPHWPRTAHELGEWLRTRDAALPPGSMTAHCIDSHDSFWWPSPGKKWRREQYGLDATRAMMLVFILSGGPFMTFVGGEVGMEDVITHVHALRRERPELGVGRSDYGGVAADDPHVYAVLRRLGDDSSVVLVNLQDRPTTVTVRVDSPTVPSGVDALAGRPAQWRTVDGSHVATLDLEPFAAAVFVS